MRPSEIVRAWKDPEFRASLSHEQQEALPRHPSGVIEIPDQVLAHTAGGATETLWSLGCCDGLTLDPVSGACCPTASQCSGQPSCTPMGSGCGMIAEAC